MLCICYVYGSNSNNELYVTLYILYIIYKIKCKKYINQIHIINI